MPLPECRLNEFYCLINVERIKDVNSPKGDIYPIGMMSLDTGEDWFRQLVLRGHSHAWSEAEEGCGQLKSTCVCSPRVRLGL